MKDKLKQFWNEPVNRFWLTCAFGTLFILCFGAYSFFKESFNPIISLGLISIALVFEVLFLIALIINTLADTTREYLEAFQEINRDLRYGYYQKKNKNKDYKGPEWNDEEFKKITHSKDRVDAFVKASIEYQQVDFKRWKNRNLGVNLDHQSQTAQRIFWVIFFGSVSGFILWISGWIHYLNADFLATIKIENKSFYTIPAALIGTLTAAPIIFIIWVFRDINNRVQIENARKDTNLKDFQKLSEWASGFHLPEIKQTTSTKNISKTGKDGQENTEETTTSQEDFIAPEGSNSISRRLGAEALQASAIAQLEAFMFGKYGEQFMQPAFLLIHSIWESIIIEQQIYYPHEEDFKESLLDLYENHIFFALNKALTGAGGNHLKLFQENLIGLKLIGLKNWNSSFIPLDLSRLRLFKVNLSYSNLRSSNFIQTILIGVNLHDADLYNANLQESLFLHALLEGTNLSQAKLQGVSFESTRLNRTKVKNAEIDRFTLFKANSTKSNENQIRENVLSRGAIWDDDPNWLIGKIQDQNLLAKIFKDCEERQKN